MEERVYWLGFSLFPGIGPKRFAQLHAFFGSAKAAWEATSSDLEKSGLGATTAQRLCAFRITCDIEAYEKRLESQQVTWLLITDSDYPPLLKEIAKPPFVLYCKGNTQLLSQSAQRYLAIVGTRKITAYGKEVTTRLTESFVSAGCIIVSGLAYGVDAVAHKTTIEHGGKTIAVLGCGVDCCYPTANQAIYDQILASNGAVVSEFPLGMQPSVGSFPSRNRIIAGLSHAVILTEGAEDSGALYTASDAASVHRPVFAVPGPITSQLSLGPNQLIAKGARVLTSPNDVFTILRMQAHTPTENHHIVGETKEEQEIIDLLQHEPLLVDELVRTLRKDAETVTIQLSLMEMKGLINHLPGGIVKLCIG